MISLGSAAPEFIKEKNNQIKELVVDIKYAPCNERTNDMNDWMIVV